MLFREANHIIVIAIPNQLIRTKHIGVAIVFQLLLLSDIVGEILERHFLAGIDRVVQRLHDVVDLLVVGFDAILYINIANKLLRIMLACERTELFNQGGALLLRYESCRLYSVNQCLELRQIESPTNERETLLRRRDNLNFNSEFLESFYIITHGSAGG